MGSFHANASGMYLIWGLGTDENPIMDLRYQSLNIQEFHAVRYLTRTRRWDFWERLNASCNCGLYGVDVKNARLGAAAHHLLAGATELAG
jgi:hypothetical protein